VDTHRPIAVPLYRAVELGDKQVGGKGYKLSQLMHAGYRVPEGFCITGEAYRRFVEAGRLEKYIHMELGRKSFATMRWEEIWDAALRIRGKFLACEVPSYVALPIIQSYRDLSASNLAVRSSGMDEDSASQSYAGLHESIIGVTDEDSLLKAVRVVWASLWSDAALLYRRELDLDPFRSAMAVVVQTVIDKEQSGIGFGRDPRDITRDSSIIEAVPGRCGDLVDGNVDPDRWIVKRSSGEIIEWTPGNRPREGKAAPLLDRKDVSVLHQTLRDVESLFGWPPDVEWTGNANDLILLQARPITTAPTSGKQDKREWYLTLRPGKTRLNDLCDRVMNVLIPQLEKEGNFFAEQIIDKIPDEELAKVIDERAAALAKWKQIYWDEFIPFAHGVRQLAVYYNDAVKPRDPYEFVGLLKRQDMIAARRNAALGVLAGKLLQNPSLRTLVRTLDTSGDLSENAAWEAAREKIKQAPAGTAFIEELDALMKKHMDYTYDGELLRKRVDIALHTIIELTDAADKASRDHTERKRDDLSPADLEKLLMDAVGPSRHEEAGQIIDIARLSWRLRDDDNVLLSRIENQLLNAVKIGGDRLIQQGRLEADTKIAVQNARSISDALANPAGGPVSIPAPLDQTTVTEERIPGEAPRQIVGQPAAKGLATGKARVFRTAEDIKRFQAGEILICDAIQPTMSHVAPLANGIVERRGGMLIHGAIIARELGIPCVNGVDEIMMHVEDGEIITVDGYLGIVTVGRPEFDLETGV
jgi:phosphohistidine swiveling domain-containing protein